MSFKEIRNGATYFFALSIFALAGAIVYFSVQIVNVATEMPDLLASIDKVNENITPVVNEVTELRKQIPAILKEISEVRKQIPPILEEVKKVREQVPPILEEAREVRVLVPGVLAEVAATRKAIPPMLKEGNRLIADASTIGENAGKGAVKGFFKGIVTAPFRLVSGMGKTLFSVGGKTEEKLSVEDLAQLDLIGSEILASETVGETRKWKNKAQGLTGKLTLLAVSLGSNKNCKKLQIQLWHKEKSILDKITTMCLDDNGNWFEQDSLSPEYD